MSQQIFVVPSRTDRHIAITLWRDGRLAAAISLMLWSGAPPVNGQASLASLRGTVTDSSGAIVPNASITLKEPATGAQVRQQMADGQGNYELIDLKPGTYRLTCEMASFKPYVADNIILESGQVRRIDVLLSVGQATQEITVSAGAAIIETESGTIGGLFNNQQHADVPLIDIYPSPSSMLTTVPGVQGGTGSLRMQGQSTTQQSQGF